MKICKLADMYQKLASVFEDPPAGYVKLPGEDYALHPIASRLLTKHYHEPVGTLIPFTVNNVQYVARIEMHGTKKAVEVFAKSGEFTQRTINHLHSLHPTFKSMVLQLITKARAAGMNLEIVQSRRTQAEQQKLIEEGKGSKVSRHPHGLAVDIAARNEQGKVYFPDRAWYAKLAAIAKTVGIQWAGEWRDDDDNHFQYPQNETPEGPQLQLSTTSPTAPALPPPPPPPKPPSPQEQAMAEFSQVLPQLYWT